MSDERNRFFQVSEINKTRLFLEIYVPLMRFRKAWTQVAACLLLVRIIKLVSVGEAPANLLETLVIQIMMTNEKLFIWGSCLVETVFDVWLLVHSSFYFTGEVGRV